MIPMTPLDPIQSFALMVRQHAISEARDTVAAVIDSMAHPEGIDGWEGPAADAFESQVRWRASHLRAVLSELDRAESIVRRWRHGL